LIKSTEFTSDTVTVNDRKVPRMIMRDNVGNSGGWLVGLVRETVKYASGARKSSLPKVAELLGALESCLEEMLAAGQARFFHTAECDPRLLVREQVLRSEPCDFVAAKIAEPDYLGIFKTAPLFAAVQPSFFSRSIAASVDMLHILLDNGQDPNKPDEALTGSTPWSTFAFRALPWSSSGQHRGGEDAFQVAVDRELFIKFLSFGANPNAREPWSGTTVFAMFLLSAFSASLREARVPLKMTTTSPFSAKPGTRPM